MQQASDLHHQNGSIGSGQPSTAPNSPPGSFGTANKRAQINGGRFDFEDGGTYCGGWEEGKAHGHGVCTGPKHQGAYSGAWNYGFEVSGVYIWPSGSSFEGQWQNGRRHGLGVEQRGRHIYRGEWTGGYKGRYGVRQSTTSTAKYEGTWANNLQDGYGSETYADGGSYQGQWQEGKRHGYGVRTSAPFGLASHFRPKTVHTSMSSLRSNENDPSDKRNHRMDDLRGGFVLKARSDEPPARRNSLSEKTKKGLFSGLKIRKQRSTGDLEKKGAASGSIRSTVSTASWISTASSQSGMTAKSVHTDSNASFTVEEEQLDPSIIETYMGEWKRDKRDGYGISERSDGLRYEGEWHNNKKHGYGVTTFRDGTQEEGKYKNNILITSQKKKHLFLIRSRKFRERIEAAVSSSQRASKIALQKADIAISRTATARGKAEYADSAAEHARHDCEVAVATAREFAPDFKPSVLERFERLRFRERFRAPELDQALKSAATSAASSPGNPKSATKPANMSRNIVQDSQLPTHQQSIAFPYQQTTNTPNQSNVSRRQSTNPLTKQQSVEYSQIPNQIHTNSTLYSHVSPQTDLSDHVSQHHSQNNPYTQSVQYPQAAAPSYQFQQQQPPGSDMYGVQSQGSQGRPPQSSQMYGSNLSSNNSPSLPHPQLQDTRGQSFGGYNYEQQPQQKQPPMQPQYSLDTAVRRTSRADGSKPPMLGSTHQPSSIDHFDHYKRPPSRDSSVDRYARAASRMSGIGSRQPSVDRIGAAASPPPTTSNPTPVNNPQATPDRNARGTSVFRGQTPAPITGNGSVLTGAGVSTGVPAYQLPSVQPKFSSPNQPFEDVLLRQRTLGQDIIPSPLHPKRTESLYLPPKPMVAGAVGGGASGGKIKLKSIPINVSLQRKKSLPDVQELPRATEAMSREEVSALGSARREEIRRQVENNERLKANPLLYLVSPQVKDWFSRQQLVLLVLIVNVVLAIMFFKMLT